MSTSDNEYLRAYSTLEGLYKDTGLNELAILLGAMDINRGDGKPMDPRMLEYWEKASESAAGVDALVEFLALYARNLTPPPRDFEAFIRVLADRASPVRSAAMGYWKGPGVG